MKRDFHIGPGAASLILIIVILTMSVLSALALMNARSDERLTYRTGTVVSAVGELYAAAERRLAELDAALIGARAKSEDEEGYLEEVSRSLPDGMVMEGTAVSWTVSDDDERMLVCAVEVLPAASPERFKRTEFRVSSEFAQIELEDTWN